LGLSELRELRQLARGEREAQAVGRGPPIGSAQEIVHKAVVPRQRRELRRWTQAAFAVSTRRVLGLMLIDRSTMTYRSRRDRRTRCGFGCINWPRAQHASAIDA